MKSGKNKNEFKIAKPANLGIFVFAVIFLYIFISIIISSKQETIRGYQVKNGMLSENRIYNAIALRDEKVVYSTNSGYINYFVNEGERAAYNNLIYCIDESGKLSDVLNKNPNEDTALTEVELNGLKQEIELFVKNFDEENFQSSKQFENRIDSEMTKLSNRRIINDLTAITSSSTNDIIDYCRFADSGVVLFYQDGFEDFLPTDLVPEDFNIENYTCNSILNDDLIKAGDFVYKYVNDENWSLVILVPNSEALRITSLDYVEVKFSETRDTSWGYVHLINSDDNNSIIELKFTNSMISFCKDRFVEIELLLEEDTGLKIPNTSIAEKAFYLIDKDFVTKGGNSSDYSVLRREYDDSGSIIKNVSIDIVKEDDDVYYVDTLSLNYGDILEKPDSPSTDSNTFIVGRQGTLIGVYNINKGYAEFNRIEILYSNDEYSIVKPNSFYGLRAYDYIALDASIVNELDFVY